MSDYTFIDVSYTVNATDPTAFPFSIAVPGAAEVGDTAFLVLVWIRSGPAGTCEPSPVGPWTISGLLSGANSPISSGSRYNTKTYRKQLGAADLGGSFSVNKTGTVDASPQMACLLVYRFTTAPGPDNITDTTATSSSGSPVTITTAAFTPADAVYPKLVGYVGIQGAATLGMTLPAAATQRIQINDFAQGDGIHFNNTTVAIGDAELPSGDVAAAGYACNSPCSAHTSTHYGEVSLEAGGGDAWAWVG